MGKFDASPSGDIPLSTACKDCPDGYFSNGAGLSACIKCRPNTSTGGPGKHTCVLCPQGKYDTLAAVGAGQDPIAVACKDCPAGYEQQDLGLQYCNPCPPGTAQAVPGGWKCSSCSAGKYDSGVENSYGKLSRVRNYISLTCTDCPAGYVQMDSGQSRCSACTNGAWQDEIGKSSCKGCPSGQIIRDLIQVAPTTPPCQDCPVGQYRIADRSYCSDCNAGTYQDKPGQSICKECPFGSWDAASRGVSSSILDQTDHESYVFAHTQRAERVLQDLISSLHHSAQVLHKGKLTFVLFVLLVTTVEHTPRHAQLVVGESTRTYHVPTVAKIVQLEQRRRIMQLLATIVLLVTTVVLPRRLSASSVLQENTKTNHVLTLAETALLELRRWSMVLRHVPLVLVGPTPPQAKIALLVQS
eukprot:c7324_g1_i4.p1 GENE.c7324_g1_i4~~c7324_g1_i4.p1  ORF type:complete len:413 (-),score=24.26 c7324_g1_i4:249-1487(-)